MTDDSFGISFHSGRTRMPGTSYRYMGVRNHRSEMRRAKSVITLFFVPSLSTKIKYHFILIVNLLLTICTPSKLQNAAKKSPDKSTHPF